MIHKDIELSVFLDMPIADGLDVAEAALTQDKTSPGKTRAVAKRTLLSLKRMLSKLAQKCKSASRWKELKRRIIQEIG